jgi:AAA15 family ATPase/GTPase
MFTERRIKIKDQFLEDGVQYIDQRSANEGFLYLLFYLTLFISDETPKFFAIDNIDNAMNPKLGSELIKVLSKLAKEHDKQTILTTHNPSVLDGLDLSDDEQRLFVISRSKSGHTQAIRVPYKESDERLSTRFIRGAIGGLPKNF